MDESNTTKYAGKFIFSLSLSPPPLFPSPSTWCLVGLWPLLLSHLLSYIILECVFTTKCTLTLFFLACGVQGQCDLSPGFGSAAHLQRSCVQLLFSEVEEGPMLWSGATEATLSISQLRRLSGWMWGPKDMVFSGFCDSWDHQTI